MELAGGHTEEIAALAIATVVLRQIPDLLDIRVTLLCNEGTTSRYLRGPNGPVTTEFGICASSVSIVVNSSDAFQRLYRGGSASSSPVGDLHVAPEDRRSEVLDALEGGLPDRTPATSATEAVTTAVGDSQGEEQ